MVVFTYICLILVVVWVCLPLAWNFSSVSLEVVTTVLNVEISTVQTGWDFDGKKTTPQRVPRGRQKEEEQQQQQQQQQQEQE